MIKFFLGGLFTGLVLTYTGLSLLAFRAGSALPMTLFFGPWMGLLQLCEPYIRRFGYWTFLTAPFLYVMYAVVIKWNEKRGRIAFTTMLIFLFHYAGVVLSAQNMNFGAEPRRILLAMNIHPWILSLGVTMFVSVNVLAIVQAWIAKD